MSVTRVTIQRQGDALGVELPEDLRTRLGLEVGQPMVLIELQDGIKLVKHSASLEKQFNIAQNVLKTQADILEGLAKYDRN